MKRARLTTAADAASLTFEPGHCYRLRSGATVQLIYLDGPDAYRFLVGELVRDYEGTPIPWQRPRMSWCPDGNYTRLDEPHPYDIVAEVSA